MLARFECRAAGLLASLAMGTLAACSGDAPTAATEAPITPDQVAAGRVSLCHRSGSSGEIITVLPSAVAAHLRDGDYLTNLFVSHASNQPNDGAHFRRIGDALAAARAGRLDRGELRSAACRITIAVAAGPFRGASSNAGDKALELFPLTVDVPNITLRGALKMGLDAGGRATVTSLSNQVTRLKMEGQNNAEPDPVPIILAQGHPRGSAGHGLTVEGFVLEGPARFGVFGIRVRGLAIRGNRFQELHVTLDLRATSAVIERNHFSGSTRCDMCLAGPGVYNVAGNRLQDGADMAVVMIPSLDAAFLAPVGVEPAPVSRVADVSAEITNNEIRGYRTGLGAAIRVLGIGVGGSDSRNSSHIAIRDNLVVNNTVGVRIDAGALVPDTRLRSDVDLTLSGNILRQSCQTDLSVNFAATPDGPDLRNSTFRLTLGGDIRFRDAWYNNPAGFGNTLLVDGRKIGHGTRQPLNPPTC